MNKTILSAIAIVAALAAGSAQAQSTLWNTAPSVGEAAASARAGTGAQTTPGAASADHSTVRQIALRPEYELYYGPAASDGDAVVEAPAHGTDRQIALRPEYELYYAPNPTDTAVSQHRGQRYAQKAAD